MTKATKNWGPNRLGNVRRVCSKYSYQYRKVAGLSAKHRQYIEDSNETTFIAILLYLSLIHI